MLRIVRESRVPLDDDQIAQAAQLNRAHVNMICRRLAAEKVTTRSQGAGGKLVNAAAGQEQPAGAGLPADPPEGPARQRWPRGRLTERVSELIAGLAGYVAGFEARQAFPGPSLYFHLRAIERRRGHQTVSSLLDDTQFLEYAYAVLPAWGMHRMGRQAAKVGDFAQITAALRETAPRLERLWPLRITTLSGRAAHDAAATAWDVIAHARVSASRTQIVAGTKFPHHLLPDLIPPIDRRYTFRFFTGQQSVASDRTAFLDWFPVLAGIGAQSREPIRDAIRRGGFMATGEAKVIDNAIIGFMQQRNRR